MTNLDLLITEVRGKYLERIGDAELPMEQVSHLVGHLVMDVFKREMEECDGRINIS